MFFPRLSSSRCFLPASLFPACFLPANRLAFPGFAAAVTVCAVYGFTVSNVRFKRLLQKNSHQH
jgi:hypothetical protein